MRYLAPAAISLATLVAAAGAAAVPGGGDVAVAAVFPPWWTRAEAATAVARADGLNVREGGLSTVLIFRSADPDFADRLRAHGALLLVDPIAMEGCSAPSASRRNLPSRGEPTG